MSAAGHSDATLGISLQEKLGYDKRMGNSNQHSASEPSQDPGEATDAREWGDPIFPREPIPGDPMMGEIVHVLRDHPGMLVYSNFGIYVYLPCELLLEKYTDYAPLVGRSLECEIVVNDEKKRCIVVRQTAWLDSDEAQRKCRQKLIEYWYNSKSPRHDSE